MKKCFRIISLMILSNFISAGLALASELVYQPINPSFGGFPANGQVLLDSANAQNTFKGDIPGYSSDPLTNFKDSLMRQVLSTLAQKLVGGDIDTVNPITLPNGFEVNVGTSTDGKSYTVSINDPLGGGSTTMTVPIY